MEMSQNQEETLIQIKELQEKTRELKKTIPKKYKPQPLPKSIKDDEFTNIIKNLKKNKSGNESKVAFILSYESGMRISEIKNLKKEHIDVARKRISIIRGKFSKDRVVPLPKTWRAWMIDFIPIQKSIRSLQRSFANAGKKASIRTELTFHSLRHGFATNLLERKVPINQVQLLLGHSNVGTTNVYIRANPEDALKSYEELF